MSPPRRQEEQEMSQGDSAPDSIPDINGEDLRQFTRSPHPYRRSRRPCHELRLSKPAGCSHNQPTIPSHRALRATAEPKQMTRVRAHTRPPRAAAAAAGKVYGLGMGVRKLMGGYPRSTHGPQLATHGLLLAALFASYPVLLPVSWKPRWQVWPAKDPFFVIPTTFDPAPLLYPALIPVFVSISLSHHTPALILPNIVLSLSSLPTPVIPLYNWINGFSLTHWLVTLIPILISEHFSLDHTVPKPLTLRGHDAELLTLLFPFHQALIPTLDFLLTTSVLPAELQLLSSALINLYLFAASPQAEILKALLWLGGMCLFVSCGDVLRWEVALARIPSWKFRRSLRSSQSPRRFLNMVDHRLCQKLSGTGFSDEPTSDSDGPGAVPPRKPKTVRGPPQSRKPVDSLLLAGNLSAEESLERQDEAARRQQRRRHTIATFDEAVQEEKVRTTPSGRRKKLMGPGLTSFLSLTAAQAQVRKWLYASYVYLISLGIIIGPIRKQDPFGWAIGYLLGNLSAFRFWVLITNLDYWISLPPHPQAAKDSCWLGRIDHLRQTFFGPANARLLIIGYCVVVLILGLAVVFQLSAVVEVDTRRKVFHGMMVLMFLPTVFVDPAFCALALSLVLAVFLLLDLFRASQLPPISRPLTYFLAPYVDGRDHRGPVIVSHIFLLIGCSIPLWLSLADLARNDDGAWPGWDVPSRDVSMVSGVICVGMGDAAASLVGRRYGRLKWFWGGGKSLEGSVAFAVAVCTGLLAVRAWLVIGGWPAESAWGSTSTFRFWVWTTCKAVLAAGGTSATEAILTGCNDNVVVPVVLWLLVRGLGV
ncbi:Phosphatidate cytidylyltransferase [Penicillium chermesinum]|nr:Phosphatidate cytidylyltransferase [Penicillium chermesinum]